MIFKRRYVHSIIKIFTGCIALLTLIFYAHRQACPAIDTFIVTFDYPVSDILRSKVIGAAREVLRTPQPAYHAANALYQKLRREICMVHLWYIRERKAIIRCSPRRPLLKIDTECALALHGHALARAFVDDRVWEQLPLVRVPDHIAVDPVERTHIVTWWNENYRTISLQDVVWHDHTHIELVPVTHDVAKKQKVIWRVTAYTKLTDTLCQLAHTVLEKGNYPVLDLRYPGRIIAIRESVGGRKGGVT